MIQKKHIVLFFVPVFIWFFYNGLLIHKFGKFKNETVGVNYFKDLAHSFLHGRLDIDCPQKSKCDDLIRYYSKYYLYWPPGPVLIYLPIVPVWGLNIWDTLVENIMAAFGVMFFILFLQRFIRRFKIPLREWEVGLIGIFWGLGTVHFYMSMTGSVWFVSQVCAQLYLFISLSILLGNGRFKYILSGIFWSLAAYTRNDLVFTLPFLFALIATENGWDLKAGLKKTGILILPFIFFSFLNLLYNYARFGEILENGLKYHNMSLYFWENFDKYGYFSTHYFSHNFITEVLHKPRFFLHYPFIEYDPEGFGVFWASPLFFLWIPAMIIFLFSFMRKSFAQVSLIQWKTEKPIIFSTLISMLGIAGITFMVMGTGWVQFAARYTLDFQLMLLIPVLFLWRRFYRSLTFKILVCFLIVCSVLIQYMGVKLFFGWI